MVTVIVRQTINSIEMFKHTRSFKHFNILKIRIFYGITKIEKCYILNWKSELWTGISGLQPLQTQRILNWKSGL